MLHDVFGVPFDEIAPVVERSPAAARRLASRARRRVRAQAMSFRGAGPYIEPVIVNGAPGVMVRFPARSLLGAFTVANGRSVAIDVIADPDKLRGLPLD